MTPEQFASVEALFERAKDLPPAMREAVLAGAQVDAEVRAKVQGMLTGHDEAAELDLLDGTKLLNDAPGIEAIGQSIGPYKLLEKIGTGGFGDVYMAQQRVPLSRLVALKILKPGMDSRAVIARFKQEQQALAVMDHPNIAKVFDAGTTPTGRPYFVMELVKGEPITTYCDQNQLTIAERLELFTQVCHAVQHAHQKAVIHRDLKPNNILVRTFDGRPEAKVIDFGILKALGQSLADITQHTGFHQAIGTPAYMSPEQTSGSMDIDTRADVYSLGVVLYELLAGALPFEMKSLQQAAMDEIFRIIREDEPPKPSTRLSRLTETLPRLAAQRKIEPHRLGKLIRGDLDDIAMKCLEKDRKRRYETASGLADDIGRFLTGEPVIAVPPSTLYRLRKYVGRHRAPLAVAGTIAVLLIGGIVGTTIFALRAEHQRNLSEERRTQVEAVSNFQSSMFSGVTQAKMGMELRKQLVDAARDACGRRGVSQTETRQTVAALEAQLDALSLTEAAVGTLDQTVLTRAEAAARRDFANQPAVLASLLQSLAGAYNALGLHEKAKSLAEETLEMRRRVLGSDHPDTLRTMSTLIGTHRRLEAGRLAELLAAEALDRCTRVLDKDDPGTLTAIYDMGITLESEGRQAEAEVFLRRALEGRRRILGNDNADTILTMQYLSFPLQYQGKFVEAAILVDESLERAERVLGPDDEITLFSLRARRSLCSLTERFDEAIAAAREVTARRERISGPNHPASMRELEMLADTFAKAGRLSDAEACLRQLVARRWQHNGKRHALMASHMRWLANLIAQQGRLPEAITLLETAADRANTTTAEEAEARAALDETLADLLERAGRWNEAQRWRIAAEDELSRATTWPSGKVVEARLRLALFFEKQGAYADAKSAWHRVIELGVPARDAVSKDMGLNFVHLSEWLAVAYERLGDFDAADVAWRRACDDAVRKSGRADDYTAQCALGRAQFCLRRNNPDGAERIAAAYLRECSGPDKRNVIQTFQTIRIFGALTRDFQNAHLYSQADAMLKEYADATARVLGNDRDNTLDAISAESEPKDILSTFDTLAWLAEQRKQWEEAYVARKKAVDFARRVLGPSPDLWSALQAAARASRDAGHANEAESLAREGWEYQQKHLPVTSRQRLNLALELMRALLEQKKTAEARQIFDGEWDELTKAKADVSTTVWFANETAGIPHTAPDLVEKLARGRLTALTGAPPGYDRYLAYVRLAGALNNQQRWEESVEAHLKAEVEWNAASLPEKGTGSCWNLNSLAYVLRGPLKRPLEAFEWRSKALPRVKELCGDESEPVAGMLGALADDLERAGELTRAIEFQKQHVAMMIRVFGAQNERTQKGAQILADWLKLAGRLNQPAEDHKLVLPR